MENEEKNENANSQTAENVEDTSDSQDNNDSQEDSTQDDYTPRERQLFARLKKAQGYEQNEDGKWVKKPQEKPTSKKDTTQSKKSDGLDYGQKAFLIANGIKGKDESELVETIMQNTGKSLEDVLESKYFKAELEEMRELKATSDATPSGKRSGQVAHDSVEYWMTKPIEDVPKDMRIKVVNAKIEKEKSTGNFYSS